MAFAARFAEEGRRLGLHSVGGVGCIESIAAAELEVEWRSAGMCRRKVEVKEALYRTAAAVLADRTDRDVFSEGMATRSHRMSAEDEEASWIVLEEKV